MADRSNKKRMLITGVSGLLGSNLAFFFKDHYDVVGVFHEHAVAMEGVVMARADLCSSAAVKALIVRHDPDIVIHCAAQANVDACEDDPKAAQRQNVRMTEHIVQALGGKRTKLVFISTDLVYGTSSRPHKEDEPLSPCNEYGRTKVLAEKAVLKRKNSLVLRTNFFGWSVGEKKSLGEWVIESLSRNDPIRGFTDVHFSALYTFDLANILDQCLKQNVSGVYNLGARTSLSKYTFLEKIASALGLDVSLINKISVDDSPLRAPRNKNTVLDVHKISSALGIVLPTAEDSLTNFVAHYRKGMHRVLTGREACYPQLDHIPYGRQWIDDDDIDAVVQVLKSPNLTQGPKVIEFEYALSQHVGAGYATVFNSGTSALHAACLAIGIGKGDEVITTPNTFVASANCVLYCGGTPVFADIETGTYNISPREIEKKITPRTKAVIPVHFAGQSCDMQRLQAVVRRKEAQYNTRIYILEDACHAAGSSYKGSPVGGCRFSDMAVFSFHPVKQMTTAEGGALLTNNKDIYRKACYFRSHGITGFPEELVDKQEGFEEVHGHGLMKKLWYYEQLHLGYNYRMTDIQCALGISQLRKLGMFQERRREIWNVYNRSFEKIKGARIPYERPDCDSNFHLYVLLIDFEGLGRTRTEVMLALKDKGIGTQVHYIPVYSHPFYSTYSSACVRDCPQMEKYYKKCLSLPLFPAMTDKDVNRVVAAVHEVLEGR